MNLHRLSHLLIIATLLSASVSFATPASTPHPEAGTTLEAPALLDSTNNGHLPSSAQTATPLVASAVPREIFQTPVATTYINESLQGEIIYKDGIAYPLRHYKTALTPNDPYSGQWWESSLGLESAWDISTGSSESLLAIIDTGVALAHEEFAGRWHENTGETGTTTEEGSSLLNCSDQTLTLDKSCNLIDDDFDGIVDNEVGAAVYENPSQLNCSDQALSLDKHCNRIDDDNNGLVDDVTGWDFVSHDSSVQAGDLNSSGSGVSHATYVTGVAAGTGNNGVGVAGVNWQTRILPIQALSDDGSGNSLSVARAIRYAVDQGADVISLSLGGAYPDSFLRLTIREAIAEGVLVVAASGNDGCNCISYPANYPEVIAVGAIDTSNLRAAFSNWGANLDIMAPGTNLTTARWTASDGVSSYAGGVAGTSLATPLVSGALTLLRSELPTASSTELLSILTSTNNRLSLAETQSRNDTFGFGTADVANALQRAITPSNVELSYLLSPTSHGNRLYSGTALEQSSDIRLASCQYTVGTIPVYRLKKGNVIFYSASSIEVVLAENDGFTSQLIAFVCLLQDFDSSQHIRQLNLHSEFEATFLKP